MNIQSLRLGTRRVARLSLVPIAVVLLAVAAIGAKVSEGRPEDVGLSAERLSRIDELIQREIDTQQISGAVTLVSRRGQIAHFKAQGLMDVESGRAMQRGAIFPIASMTKPITGVAVLMLVEEGKIRLSDPVSRFIPEFRDTKVAIRRPATWARGLGRRHLHGSCRPRRHSPRPDDPHVRSRERRGGRPRGGPRRARDE